MQVLPDQHTGPLAGLAWYKKGNRPQGRGLDAVPKLIGGVSKGRRPERPTRVGSAAEGGSHGSGASSVALLPDDKSVALRRFSQVEYHLLF